MVDIDDNQLPGTAVTALHQSLQPAHKVVEDEPDVDTLHSLKMKRKRN